MGAHARGANRHSLGLLICGDNTKPKDAWTVKQIDTATQVLRVWLWMFPGAKIAGHMDVGTTRTLCPAVDVRLLFDFPAVNPRNEGE